MQYIPEDDQLIAPRDQPFCANENDPFYVSVGCLLCNAPEVTAPILIGSADENGNPSHDHNNVFSCYFKKQPANLEEIVLAAEAMVGSCVQCLRYRGTNIEVLKILENEGCAQFCDAVPQSTLYPKVKMKKRWYYFWKNDA